MRGTGIVVREIFRHLARLGSITAVEVKTGVLLTRSYRDKAKICLKKFPIQNGLKQRRFIAIAFEL
jgi:hypothetical protein